jgi:hypothetical protein
VRTSRPQAVSECASQRTWLLNDVIDRFVQDLLTGSPRRRRFSMQHGDGVDQRHSSKHSRAGLGEPPSHRGGFL